MRSCSATPYRLLAPPACRGATAARPSRLNRATSWLTASPDRRPAACAATVNVAPAATASSALARATWSARSLPARAIASSAARSAAVSGRNGAFGVRAIISLVGFLTDRAIAANEEAYPPVRQGSAGQDHWK
jgi:hypothetical protein